MSSTKTPNARSSEPIGVNLLRGRFLLALGLCLLPWPAVWAGLYRGSSAPLAFILYHGVCFAGALLLRSPGMPTAEKIYPFQRTFLLGIVLAGNTIILLLYFLVGAALLDRPHVLGLLERNGLPPAAYPFLFPYFAFVNPLAEELFWRGGVYAAFRHRFPTPAPAVLLASLFFGAWHWLVMRLFVPPLAALGATLGVVLVGVALTIVYERTRRLAYSIALHALAADAPLLILLILIGRG